MNIIEKIDMDIAALHKRKADIQEKCSHPEVTTEYWTTDGNILTGRDPTAGYTNTCALCCKVWSVKTRGE